MIEIVVMREHWLHVWESRYNKWRIGQGKCAENQRPQIDRVRPVRIGIVFVRLIALSLVHYLNRIVVRTKLVNFHILVFMHHFPERVPRVYERQQAQWTSEDLFPQPVHGAVQTINWHLPHIFGLGTASVSVSTKVCYEGSLTILIKQLLF